MSSVEQTFAMPFTGFNFGNLFSPFKTRRVYRTWTSWKMHQYYQKSYDLSRKTEIWNLKSDTLRPVPSAILLFRFISDFAKKKMFTDVEIKKNHRKLQVNSRSILNFHKIYRRKDAPSADVFDVCWSRFKYEFYLDKNGRFNSED